MNIGQSIVVISKEELRILLNEQIAEWFEKIDKGRKSVHQEELNEFLSRKEAAAFLKISLPTLSDWTKRKIIKSSKIESRVYYLKSELLKLGDKPS